MYVGAGETDRPCRTRIGDFGHLAGSRQEQIARFCGLQVDIAAVELGAGLEQRS